MALAVPRGIRATSVPGGPRRGHDLQVGGVAGEPAVKRRRLTLSYGVRISADRRPSVRKSDVVVAVQRSGLPVHSPAKPPSWASIGASCSPWHTHCCPTLTSGE